MIPTYSPVLKALKSEFKAIANMDSQAMNKTCPLFEVCRIGKNITEAARFKDVADLSAAYLEEVATGIAGVWNGRLTMIDPYRWDADACVETGEHVIPYVYRRLEDMGVPVIPVVGYDRWENVTYKLALQGLVLPESRCRCIRLDRDAIEDSADPTFFLETINDIVESLDLNPTLCSILIDFGDVTGSSIEEMTSQANTMLDLLEPFRFKHFSIAGCSLPSSIDKAVKKHDAVGEVLRKEMLVWKALRAERPRMKVVFGDYGVRGPTTSEGVGYGNTNCKIRYTIDNKYLIARGHSISGTGKGAQMWGLSQKVRDSGYFMGDEFSWGDRMITSCSEKKFKGAAGTWIEIDTNHHIAHVVAEVQEFELNVVGATAKTGAVQGTLRFRGN